MDAIKNTLIAEGVAAFEPFALIDPAGSHKSVSGTLNSGAAYLAFRESVLSVN